MGKDNGSALLESAFDLDRRGKEAHAIPLYRQAIRAGLHGESLRDAMVCLGSSLRTVGQLTAARRILLKARKQFPGDPVVVLFLALVEHDAGHIPLALRQVAHLYLSTSTNPDVAKYRAVLGRKFHAARGKPCCH
jgi:Flp pilus assembly protein TadD